jgi:hypothetical protein
MHAVIQSETFLADCRHYAGDDVPILMIGLIDKGERANLSHAERNAVRVELAGYAQDYRARKRVRKMKDAP